MLLSEQLKIQRIKNNYSQEQLAMLLFVSHQSISKWERGINIPSIDNLLLLSDLYNLSLDELIRGSDFFRKPFLIGEKMNAKKFFLAITFWTALSFLFTGFGYQPWWVFGIIMLVEGVIVLPVGINDYRVIDNHSLTIGDDY